MFQLVPMGVMGLQVHLERFEGPLALLLHLIREQEMDIFDIDIASITQQYLDYIKTMKTLDLEGAGDFVAMAATLLQIKSRMLLPNYNEAGEEVTPDDPRRELVQRLLEYEKFQEASKLLKARPWVGRDVWLRGQRLNLDAVETSDDVILEDNPLFSLISSYRQVVRNMKIGIHKVMGAMQSVASRIIEMKDFFIPGQRVEFSQLITAEKEKRSSQILITFLSLLELAKMGFVSIFQADNYGQIQIDPKKVIDTDVLSQVESYESVESEQVAQQILAESVSETVARLEGRTDDEAEVLESATDEEIMAEEERLLGASDEPLEIPAVEPEIESAFLSDTDTSVSSDEAPAEEQLNSEAPAEKQQFDEAPAEEQLNIEVSAVEQPTADEVVAARPDEESSL